MSIDALREEISIQLELLDRTVHEIESLEADLRRRAPTTRESAAASAFLADFYTGVENILKRISHGYGVPLPAGDGWHVELCNRFCPPGFSGLPIVFDEERRKQLSAYRPFRHVVHHGYSLQL